MQTKTQKPADEYFRKAHETPGEFVALVIVLRFLWANQKMELIKNAQALYRDNGPLNTFTKVHILISLLFI